MSLCKEKEIICPNPKCGNKAEMKIWESLNATIDPETKNSLLEEKINWFKCEKCGLDAEIAQTLLYHD